MSGGSVSFSTRTKCSKCEGGGGGGGGGSMSCLAYLYIIFLGYSSRGPLNETMHRVYVMSIIFGYLEVSGPREVLPVLVEGHCHHTVGRVECLLYSVAMVNVYVNIQHTLMVSGMGNGTRSNDEREGNKEGREG